MWKQEMTEREKAARIEHTDAVLIVSQHVGLPVSRNLYLVLCYKWNL